MRVWLKEARISAGLTLHQLSEAVGVTEQSLSYYENGDRRPTPEIAMRIASYLHFPWTRFYVNGEGGAERDAG